ncbi:TPA: hypothetical protein DD449_03500 [Candidatus Berkelbacteria bacterium]|uniref:PRC-barrel domain-containing protein n=1 Tax=Berkelbacteria bacterium GW2011_GWE1_39_12 TaxID=1618337 RepID=A0A0G4B2F1_9BACT|nr:MAG: PRC-barrel domain-containing protein [Berkelbacteria bacterium GW2011_GWE1_39_12]HBO60723.1 hypothetical protein [Candidatus Berkelbacteria bacterium]
MFIEAKKIIGLPIAAMDAEAKVGEVRDLVFDPNNGNLLGLLVKMEGLLGPTLALSFIDILEWDPNGIVTESLENLVPASEIVRINEIIKNKIRLIGMSARTESGKRLGIVQDLLIDTELSVIAKYYLKDLISGLERVLPADKVVRIEKEVIFTDDSAIIPTGVQNATA